MARKYCPGIHCRCSKDARKTDFTVGAAQSTERTLGIKKVEVNAFCKSHGFHVKYQVANAKGPAKPAKKNARNLPKANPCWACSPKTVISCLLSRSSFRLGMTLRIFSEAGR